MTKFNKVLGKHTYLLWILLVGVVISSCSSYKGTTDVEDGIYSQPEKKVVVIKEQKAEKDNFFARELDKYETVAESDEIILDAEEYYSDEEYDDEENVESNAAWGYDTKEVVVIHHVNYNWYHPYHSSFYYGYNWGYNNWYYPSYRYRPWGYYNYAYYGYPYNYGSYYNPYFYGSYYGSYNYGGYGYYNPSYYGGYGYNAYDQNYTRPDNQYGRRADYGTRYDNRRSLSRSVADVNRGDTKPSLIRGSGTISERVNRRTTTENRTPTFDSSNPTRVQRGTQVQDNTSRTRTTTPTRDNSVRTRTTSPRANEGTQRTNTPANSRTNTSRTTTPTRTTTPARTNTTKPSSTSPRTTTKKTKSTGKKSSYSPAKSSSSSSGNYSSGSSTRSSNSGTSSTRSSSSSSSRGSSKSSGSSSKGRRR